MRIPAIAMLVSWALALAAPASAQQVMTTWSPAELKSVLAEVKAKVLSEDRDDDDNPSLSAESEDGLQFETFATGCEKKNGTDDCAGLELAAVFNLEDEEDVAEALSDLSYAAVAIADVGDGDLKVNLEVFLFIANKIWEKLDDAGYFDN